MFIKNGSLRDASELLKLDYAIFPTEWHLPASFVKKIIEKNPHTYRVLSHLGKIKGYYGLYPLARKPYELLLQGKLKETDLEHHVVDYTMPRNVCLYLFTIIVDIHDLHRKQYAKALIQDIPRTLSSLRKKGITLEEIGAIAISPDGERILTRLGMEAGEDISEKIGTRGIVHRGNPSHLQMAMNVPSL